jgi:hypothetical protein
MQVENRIPFSKRFQYGFYHTLDHFIGSKAGKALTINSRRRFYRNLHAYLKEKGKGQLLPLERRKDLSLKEFKDKYLRYGIPVILEGAAKDWPCVKKWSFNYFKELHGDDKIVMADQLYIENPYKEVTLAEVIDGINKGDGNYYRFYPLLQRHPEHLLDLDYKWLRSMRNKNTWMDSFQVFLGDDNTVTPLHNANLPNLFTQVVGEKKWTLYHHHNTAVIDPPPGKSSYRKAPYKTKEGPFNPFQPNYDSPYSLFQYIDGYTLTLQPGDILWNPSFYWHAVQNQGKSIGIGYRWLPPAYCFKISFLYSFLDLFSARPPIWKSMQMAREDVNFIHLHESGKLNEYLNKKQQINR